LSKIDFIGITVKIVNRQFDLEGMILA